MKHTPGPWRINGSLEHFSPLISDSAPANARLIAAAPDMLAALVLLVDGDGKPDECPRAMNAARAALAKARGE